LFLCLYVLLSCVGSGFCDQLITLPKESYHVSNNIIETKKRRPWPDPGWSATEEKRNEKYMHNFSRKTSSKCISRKKTIKYKYVSY
jgi:hypothetical protein